MKERTLRRSAPSMKTASCRTKCTKSQHQQQKEQHDNLSSHTFRIDAPAWNADDMIISAGQINWTSDRNCPSFAPLKYPSFVIAIAKIIIYKHGNNNFEESIG